MKEKKSALLLVKMFTCLVLFYPILIRIIQIIVDTIVNNFTIICGHHFHFPCQAAGHFIVNIKLHFFQPKSITELLHGSLHFEFFFQFLFTWNVQLNHLIRMFHKISNMTRLYRDNNAIVEMDTCYYYLAFLANET